MPGSRSPSPWSGPPREGLSRHRPQLSRKARLSNPELTDSWQQPRDSESPDYKKPHYGRSGAGPTFHGASWSITHPEDAVGLARPGAQPTTSLGPPRAHMAPSPATPIHASISGPDISGPGGRRPSPMLVCRVVGPWPPRTPHGWALADPPWVHAPPLPTGSLLLPSPPQSWECSKLPLHTWCAYISTQEAAGPHFTPLHLHSGGCYPHLPYPWPPRTPLTFPNSGYMTTPFMMLFLAPGPLQSPDSNSPSVMLSRMPPLGQSPVCCCPSHQAEHLAGREPELPVVSVSSQAPITRRPPVLSLGWKEIGERLPTPPCPSPTQRVHVPCLPVCLGKGGKNRACPILLYHTGVAAAKPATRFPYPCPRRLPLLKRLVHSLPGIRASQ